ncbi:MAG TPA: hypothetical protein VMR31_09465 [Myxococcota bacterium]|nr:hypothetical protein [Myxococcota bacterium]
MKRYLAVLGLAVVTGTVAAPAFAAEVFQTATLGASSSGSYSIGSDGSDLGNMVGAAFVVPNGNSLDLTGVGATFDGNYNLLPGSGEQKIFIAIVALGDGGALPSFAPSDIGGHALASIVFAPPTVAGDFAVPTSLVLGPGAYAAIFGGGGLLGSDAAGQAGLADGNATLGSPNVFSSFYDPGSWSSYGFDTGIRIFETGTLTPVPEPDALVLLSLGFVVLCAASARLRRPQPTRP